MAKKKMTLEEKLEEAIVKDIPYEVPENWIWVKLNGGFADCLDKFRKPINSAERAKRVGEIPYYGATGQVGFIDDYLTNENLVLVGEDGAPFLDILKNKSYIIDGKAWVNNHAHILKSYYGIDGNKYLMHYLNVFNYNDYVNGTTRLKLTQASMNKIPVPLPPLKEQQRIVDKIESLFEKLDKAKELIEEARDDFEKRKSAILEKAFRGELTKAWRRNNLILDNQVILRINEFYSDKLSKKEYKILTELQSKSDTDKTIKNSNWIKCNIGAIAKVTNGSTPSRKEENFWGGDIPWVSSGEVKNNRINHTKECITEEGFKNSSVKLIKKGSVLIAMIGEGKTRGQSSILDIDATINQNIAAIDLSHEEVMSEFLWYWLQYNYKRNRGSGNGTGPKALNCQKVRELDCIVPPKREQIEIVGILDKLLEEESKIEELTQLEEQIELIKKSILAKAFRGQLGTNCEDDESALELLKKILSKE
ncbi:restriction endonuclease subunit S [Clostridium sp. SM-530-WT-3G]|uniref:restriction endonuclease subunit S n=1 Tax=Clostridium sp. SM-530-WT-3G TaxID=2725303 RepID=UPI00145C88F0|nr:restriction endonuclease subunit S [Clostridium sp. SM-530-WT-3G]NME83762.1 restriction endonuclease subunit S [Clostridium sp. SM-530-WT-3G]